MTLFTFLFGLVSMQGQDTLTLFECHKKAVEHAPRMQDKERIRQIGSLKIANAETGWLPSMVLNGKLSYQSDVVTLSLEDSPVPFAFPEVPHDQYGLNLDISQTIYDGGMIQRKRTYEMAAADADLQQVEVDLHGLKEQVNNLFFSILLVQENLNNLDIHIDNLITRREVMEAGIEHGMFMASDLKLIDVEILRMRQAQIELGSRKSSFTEMLKVSCGENFPEGTLFEKPRLELTVDNQDMRPEYRWFELKDASLEAGKQLVSRKRMPVLYAFGQTGYGKPGYNMLNDQWDFYYMVGAGFRWNVLDWKQNQREQQVIEQQQYMLSNKKITFDRKIRSMVVSEETKVDQLARSLEIDHEVLGLQKDISRQAATKLANGTITATEYIIELNKENLARISLSTHQVQYMQSVANTMTIQGKL